MTDNFLILLCICLFCATASTANPATLSDCYNECGTSAVFFSDAITTRAFGAALIVADQLPFFGSITAQIPGCSLLKQCSAIIVGKRHVLCSSHCLMYKPKELSMCDGAEWIGDNDYDQTYRAADLSFFAGSENRQVATKHDIRKFSLYPTLRDSGSEAFVDLALLELTADLVFSTKVRAACLPTEYHESAGETVQFVGFGKSDILQKEAPTVGAILKHSDRARVITTTAITSPALCKLKASNQTLYLCAGIKGAGLTAGDSGGGLLLNRNGRMYVIGIASQTGALADTKVTSDNIRRDLNPDLFIRTTSFCNWISIKSGQNISCMTMVGPSDRCSERFSNAVPKLTEQIVAAADGDGTWEERPRAQETSSSSEEDDQKNIEEKKDDSNSNQSVWTKGIQWITNSVG